MNQDILNIQLNADKTLLSTEARTERILEIRLQAPRSARLESRPELNLALVIDRSGSMHGAKLECVKQAAAHVLDQLQAQDRVSLVAYDSVVRVLMPSIPVSNGNRFELKRVISGLHSGSSTNLYGGWLTGCKQVATAAQDGTLNRTLLLTDGLANEGETDPRILAQHAFELRNDSVTTSTFGVGYGFNEHLLEAMANQGGGNFYFIEDPADITRIFLQEFGELVGISARKVELKIDLPAFVDWQVLGGWATECKDGNLRVFIGDVLAGKTQDIYIKLQVPANGSVPDLAFTARVFGQGKPGQVFEGQATLNLEYASSQHVYEAPVNRELMERYSLVDVAESATEALKLEREGEREAAYQRLNQSINMNRPYISAQEDLKYRDLSDRMRQGMTEPDRKSSHFEIYKQRREKDKKRERESEGEN